MVRKAEMKWKCLISFGTSVPLAHPVIFLLAGHTHDNTSKPLSDAKRGKQYVVLPKHISHACDSLPSVSKHSWLSPDRYFLGTRFCVCLEGISHTYLGAYFSDFEMSVNLSPKRIMSPFCYSLFHWTTALSVPSRISCLLTSANTGAVTPQRLTVWL